MNGSGGSGLQIPPDGLTVLVDPDNPFLDIVFVHGFTGHPEETWTHNRGDITPCYGCNDENEADEPPVKFLRLGLFAKCPQQGRTGHKAVYWPRDLVPRTLPNARVLTYGYDTHIRHKLGPPVSRNTVYDIAGDFLVALEAKRRPDTSRPVIFIAHSLGGIVVKEMLRQSSVCRMSQSHLHKIFESTVGIIFFGTPHAGADPRGFPHHVFQKVIEFLGWSVNEQIVNTLLPSSERLRELRNEFGSIAHQRKWIIHSFQEQFGVWFLNNQKVVEDTSSYLNYPLIETTEHIARNHMDMCRFTGFEDVEYQKVAAALNRICNAVFKHSTAMGCLPLSNQRRMLLNSLGFDQLEARHMNIKNAHAKTCKWLLSKSEYCDWLDVNKLIEHHGFLWIKGKPGTGKSTIMKYALSHARRTMKDRIIIMFFFNARGGNLEKSTLGMYRSLLLQLLERVPELQRVFDLLPSTMWNTSGQHIWTVEILKELFEHTIKSLGNHHLTCYIDALDECDEKQIRDMIAFFEHLGEQAIADNIRFHVCFSSRHYPHITIKKGLSLILEGQEGHNQDIVNYLDSELKIGHSKLAEQIRSELFNKASGVFMWVVLVVEILNTEYDGGRVHELRQRIRDIPADLHELFRDILTRGPHNRGELLLCIQWVLFAKQPLTPEELYFAILTGIKLDAAIEWDPEEVTPEVMRRFILNSSKGLVEVTKSKIPTVQFIHESVRDFLLKENGLSKIWSDLGNNFQVQSHERLKRCCLAYMNMDVTSHVDLSRLPKAFSQEAADLRQSAGNKFPFLEYAVRNVLYHAEVAESCGLPQDDFLQSFPHLHWINLRNLFEKYEVRRYTQSASLLYILAENNMANLVRVSMRISPLRHPIFDEEDERYGTPFLAALVAGSEDAVCAMLESEVHRHPSNSVLHDLYIKYRHHPDERVQYKRDLKYQKDKAILLYTAENNDTTLSTFLFETGRYDPNLRDNNGRTLLAQAAASGNEASVKWLLSTGRVEDPDSRDNYGWTPLSLAAGNGDEAIVKLLLSTGGVDPDSRDNRGQTPLSRAAGNGYEAIVKLLLSTGKVVPDSRDDSGWTPLSLAARSGHEAVVKLLLSTGVDPESRDHNGRTPFSEAAWGGHEAVAKLLLATGEVDPDSRSILGQTPLFQAAKRGHEGTVEWLLATGEVDPYAADIYGKTPLSVAESQGYNSIVDMLLAYAEERKLEVSCWNSCLPMEVD